jgi:hypothetical protein
VVCVKQLKGSSLTQSDVQARLKELADDRFSEDSTASSNSSTAGGGRLSQGLNVGPGSAAWQSFRSPVVSHKDVSKHVLLRFCILLHCSSPRKCE